MSTSSVAPSSTENSSATSVTTDSAPIADSLAQGSRVSLDDEIAVLKTLTAVICQGTFPLPALFEIDLADDAAYINDLMSLEERVSLLECPASIDVVGKHVRDLGLVVRLHLGDQCIGFLEGARTVIQARDVILDTEPTTGLG